MTNLVLIQTQIFSRSQELGWTHAELARRAGVARETVSRLKQRQDADFSLLAKLCQALGLTIEARSEQPLRLNFPYNWSNPAMSADAKMAAILERGLFEDVLEAARYWGLRRLQAVAKNQVLAPSVERMLRNISAGFAA
ncbi:MAG: helix-turn-helix transcriptional regulator [Brachymonas sp.]|nr:helix-turn-helix transcriptional regulator [Brachymonas sp.]